MDCAERAFNGTENNKEVRAAIMEADLEREVRQRLLSSKNEQPKNSCKLKDDSTPTSFPPDDTDAVSVTFNAGNRPYRDSIFAVLFVGTILVTFGFGIVAFTRADLNLDSNLRLSKFNRTTNKCEIVQQPGPLEETDDSESLALMIPLPICALVLTFPVGVLFLWLLQRYTRGIVLLVVPVLTLVPLGQSVYWFIWCYGIDETCATEVSMSTQIFHAFYYPLLSAFILYHFWKDWSKTSFEIPIQLLKMATSVLKENFVLLILHPIVFLGSMAMVGGPFLTFIWYASNNGKIVPNFDAVNDPSKGCDQAFGYPCCRIVSPNLWIVAYIQLAIYTYLWVYMVTIHLQMLIVSGTISEWYFAPTGSSIVGNIKRSLLRLLNTNRQGMIFVILRGCFSWMFQFSENHPKIAANFAATSWDSFWNYSKETESLLQQKSLCRTVIGFATVAPYTILGMTTIYALLQSFIVYGALEYFTNNFWQVNKNIASFCFFGALLGLGYFLWATVCVISTVYICYAMEKNVGEISKPEICHAYMLLEPQG